MSELSGESHNVSGGCPFSAEQAVKNRESVVTHGGDFSLMSGDNGHSGGVYNQYGTGQRVATDNLEQSHKNEKPPSEAGFGETKLKMAGL
ncbi:hypothetical protein [Stieleria varia]|uniref:hypothetical protein n=1 Tax=Stieleria varia TaxID=2528005 RepID=UPI0011B65128|nr:hypothetical protein [Stieleria varia]